MRISDWSSDVCSSDLVAKLRHAGLPDDRPAALVSHATLPQMRILTATLGSIVTRAQAAQVAPPALFVVGEVVDLHAVFGASDLQAVLHPAPVPSCQQAS